MKTYPITIALSPDGEHCVVRFIGLDIEPGELATADQSLSWAREQLRRYLGYLSVASMHRAQHDVTLVEEGEVAEPRMLHPSAPTFAGITTDAKRADEAFRATMKELAAPGETYVAALKAMALACFDELVSLQTHRPPTTDLQHAWDNVWQARKVLLPS